MSKEIASSVGNTQGMCLLAIPLGCRPPSLTRAADLLANAGGDPSRHEQSTQFYGKFIYFTLRLI